VLGYGWVSFGFRLGYLQTHTDWLFCRLWNVTFRTASLFAVAIIREQFLVLILPLVQHKRITFTPCVPTFDQRIFELHWVAFPVGYRCDDIRWLFYAFALSELALRPELQEREDACVTG
jgi:hypothetical protein